MTTISYVPDGALEFAELSLTGAGGKPKLQRSPDPEPWDVEAIAGDYDAAATFPNKAYPNRSRSIRLAPPFVPCDLYKENPP